MKVTYLLGAGASYKAIPIIGELNNAFEELKKLYNLFLPDERFPECIKDKKLFESHMTTGAYNSKIYGTIDTFAKKLALTNNEDLVKMKGALSLFFTLWQEINKNELSQREVISSLKPKVEQVPYMDIDDRYFGLLTNYLEKKGDKVVLNDDVNFITWNYDAQLELTTAFILEKPIGTILEEFKVYPYVKENPRIVHLNGLAGIYRDQKENKMKHLYRDNFENARNTEKLLKEKLFFMSATEESTTENSDYFSYAWENDPTSIGAIKNAQMILKETDYLIVIGYSFPTFNDSVDKELFDVLKKSNTFKKLYYQDPNANEEIFTSRFGFDPKKIKIVNNVNQFLLPLETPPSERMKPMIY
jgi:hypothetical protein